MEQLRIRDVRRVVDFAYELGAASTMQELRDGVARGLVAIVGATLASYTEVDPRSGRVSATCDATGSEVGRAACELGRLSHEHPLITRPAADGARAETISDYLSARRFRASELYAAVYRRIEAGDQLAVNLPSADGRIVGIALNRRRSTFTRRDRELLELLRPLLARACRDVAARQGTRDGPPVVELSCREQEILELVRLGRTNRQVAMQLQISPRTVENHLHAVYRKLGVPNRTSALAATAGLFACARVDSNHHGP